MSIPIEITLNSLIQEANSLGKRALDEDRPELVVAACDLVRLADRLAGAFKIAAPSSPSEYSAELKKRFLLSTSIKIVAGIFTDQAVAAPIDPTPIKRNSTLRLGVGLAEYRQEKVVIDAPCYHPTWPCFGLVIPAEPLEEWYIVRDTGDLSCVMTLEHAWMRSYGRDMVIVKEVIGIGRDAIGMAEETRPSLREWIARARKVFQKFDAGLSSNADAPPMPGFYHFGKLGFCRHPWVEVVVKST
jgi:hypothetical protein